MGGYRLAPAWRHPPQCAPRVRRSVFAAPARLDSFIRRVATAALVAFSGVLLREIAAPERLISVTFAALPFRGAGVSERRLGPRRLHIQSRRQRTCRAATDPNFVANVGQAIDTLRYEHGLLPDGAAPGLTVAAPGLKLEIAQVPAMRFEGERQYGEFWNNFRTGVTLVASSARSEVVNVVHSGQYIRIRWRLLLTPRAPTQGEAAATAANALQAARGAFGAAAAAAVPSSRRASSPSGLLGGLFGQAENMLGEAEQWASSTASGANANQPIGGPTQERIVELNSVYELDCWNGRVVSHTLEFRSPTEDFDLLGAFAGVPSFR